MLFPWGGGGEGGYRARQRRVVGEMPPSVSCLSSLLGTCRVGVVGEGFESQ